MTRRCQSIRRLIPVTAAILFLPTICIAQAQIDFTRDVRPILSDKCFTCHGPDEGKREGGFRLDVVESALEEADSGDRPIVPGDLDASQIYQRLIIDDEDLRMPPVEVEKPLTPAEVETIRLWIDQGAEFEEHWAFITPSRPPAPNIEHKNKARNPIDNFIVARLANAGLTGSPEADKVTLARRVTFDLTGLPPTPAEIDAFLRDDSADAYERLVERLLRSPRYGEHMARFWLDAARYGDTHGLHLDNYREMWLYRDWVVDAFNRNLPFDQFTIEQLAGDLLPDPTLEQLVATGFNRCHVTTNEGGSIVEEVYVRNVVDRVVTTGTVFMGMTFECSRCHDHKFDPFTMNDFYSMFAFFNSIDGSAMDGNRKDPAPVIRVPSDEQERQLEEYNERVSELERRLRDPWPEVDQLQAEWEKELLREPTDSDDGQSDDGQSDDETKLPEELLKIVRTTPHERGASQARKLRGHFRNKVAKHEELAEVRSDLEQTRKARKELEGKIPTTLIFRERAEPRPAFYLERGEYDQRGDQVSRRTPTALPPMSEGLPRNRLGLARWLLDPQHPLTARVAVNRLWQQVFGAGIVKTLEDFGSQGELPSHPELLDWLAMELMQPTVKTEADELPSRWDVKHIMRLIVTSATYRQSSRATVELIERDPENRLLARGPRFRLDAEMLRDQALSVSGLLHEKLGGPSVKPPQPDGLWFSVGYSGSNTVRFVADKGPDKVHRRTLYTFVKRTSPPPQMTTFDAPSREACTMRRERTNTPLQALLLMNDPQYVEAAHALAARSIREGGGGVDSRAAYMFRLCTGRRPDSWELDQLRDELRQQLEMYRQDVAAAEKLLSVGDATAEPDLDAYEMAAWTMVANLILNLDEVVTKN